MDYEDFKNEVEQSKQFPLNIKDGVLDYRNTTYPLRNISHIKLVEKSVTEMTTGFFKALLGLLGIGILILGLFAFFGNCTRGQYGGTVASAIMIILGAWLRSLVKEEDHQFYGLAIETNSGSNELFFSDDKDFIEKVKEVLSRALAHPNDIRYTIHIGDKHFIDNSVRNLTQNSYYEFNVEQHTGLSEEQKDYILGDFKRSIEKLQDELSTINESQVTKNELSNIVNEINSDRPDPSKIKQSYEKIKSIADGYSTITSLSEFGGAIGRTVMMFV
ncbi:DUF6232 family protein [Sulfurovum mangrovi]|uniref:DUF6232 family protein n=1 Tax=Sulfurovum mangrovi TaxID=2893889 RepID=UPI001E62A478|nr:DUF6232 family protein [Sulfurovum mangrovi]UFH59937.1 DUF6232 family protein [Sulfurovum mangrovi]